MANFAEIWTGSTGGTYEYHEVVRVSVVSNDQEYRGEEFLANDLDLGGKWIQTSYTNRIRKNFAGVGMIYNEEYDFFVHKQPYPSWTLNTDSGIWEAPTPYPEEGIWEWDEDTLSWVEFDFPVPSPSLTPGLSPTPTPTVTPSVTPSAPPQPSVSPIPPSATPI